MILDVALRDHESVTIYGVTSILDLDNITYEHVLQLPPNVIRNLVHAWQGCYPVRIYSLDFINAHRFVNTVLNIFRSFMNTKLKQRVHVHSRDKLKLNETLPKNILPKEYGGTNGTVKELSGIYFYFECLVKVNANCITIIIFQSIGSMLLKRIKSGSLRKKNTKLMLIK